MATNISWTDETLNFATGCTKVSPGCQNCYMFRQYPRWKRMGVRGYEADPDMVTLISERIKKIASWRKPRMVFINSMSDTFHRDIPDHLIDSLMLEMMRAPQHTFQILTKRPGRVRHWWEDFRERLRLTMVGAHSDAPAWPDHIWLGTSVESAKYLPRIKTIAGIAPVTFISAEPLLGPLAGGIWRPETAATDLETYLKDGSLQWVICGGESGPDFRPMKPEWAADIQFMCEFHSIPYFFKQHAGRRPATLGRELDGVIYDEMPTIGRVEKEKPHAA